MPVRACTVCGELVPISQAAAHRRAHTEANRPSAAERGYTSSAWRRIRAEHLRLEPDCRRCGAPATDVDHIIPRSAGGSDEHDNLRSLCHPCHSRRTAIDQSGWG